MPQAAAGMRIDPPVSVPTVASAIPAATLAADPPLEPPGDRLGSCGFLAGPNADSSFVVPNASFAQGRDRRGVARRHMSFAHEGRRRRRLAGDVNQILDGNRDAVKRAAIAAGSEFAIGLARLSARRVGHHDDERVQARVVRVDAAKARVGHLFRGHFARAEQASEFLDGQRFHSVHVCGPARGPVSIGPVGDGLRSLAFRLLRR